MSAIILLQKNVIYGSRLSSTRIIIAEEKVYLKAHFERE